jgi:hypothetical protein
LLILAGSTYVTHIRPQGLQLQRFGILAGNHSAGLLEGQWNRDGAIHEESGGQRRKWYSDVTDGGVIAPKKMGSDWLAMIEIKFLGT